MNELDAMRLLAAAWPGILDGTDWTNSCVHASIAAETALRERGFDVIAVVADLVMAIPACKPPRLISTNLGDYKGPVVDRGPNRGYDHHAIVVGRDGFLDLTAAQYDTIDTPLVFAWEQCGFDYPGLRGNDLNPSGAPHGDVWGIVGRASLGAKRGPGEEMIMVWSVRDQDIQVHPHPLNFQAVEFFTGRLREIASRVEPDPVYGKILP